MKKNLFFLATFVLSSFACAQFTSPFAPSDLSYYQNGTTEYPDSFVNDGVVSFNATYTTLTLVSTDIDTQDDNYNLNYFNGVEWDIPTAGTLSFDWTYSSDDYPGFDGLYYLSDPTLGGFDEYYYGSDVDYWTLLSDTDGESGSWSQDYSGGEKIAIAAYTEDGDLGAGTGVITNFVWIADLAVSNATANQLNIYPNPVSDVLNIVAQNKIDKIEIFNLTGQLVDTKLFEAKNGTINVSNLPKGTYVLKATIDGKARNIKVLKK